MTTTEFEITFTRYDKKAVKRVIGAPQFIVAENFGRAFAHAQAVLIGMKAADAERTYEILSIVNRGMHGDKAHPAGASMFDTTESL